MDLGYKDKVVVVLSSGAGIGKGIATEIAREGAKVVISTAPRSRRTWRRPRRTLRRRPATVPTATTTTSWTTPASPR